MTTRQRTLYCSFCAKAEHEVWRLIGGIGDACICNECVGRAAGALFESEGWQRAKLADAQLAESAEADFAAAEWTFRLRPGYRVSAGRFLIVPTFRTMRELEEYDRRQREQRVKAQAGRRRKAQKWQRVRRAWAWIVWRLNTPLEV